MANEIKTWVDNFQELRELIDDLGLEYIAEV